jgi:hypothetical protein
MSGTDKTSDLLAQLERAITFPSNQVMKDVYQTAYDSPAIAEQRSTLDQIDEAIRAQAAATRGRGADPTSALSYLASYFTDGKAKYLPPEKTAKSNLLDYALKSQDDRRDLTKAIGDYIGRMRGGFSQTQDTKGTNTTFNISSGEFGGKGNGTRPPKTVPETTVAKFTQGQSAIDEVRSLRGEIAQNPDIMGPVKGMSTYSPFTFDNETIEKQKELNNRFMLLRQTVGKLFEGGVLRKEDETKYKRIFVDIRTDPKVGSANMKELETMLRRDVSRYMDNMGRAGYDTGGFVDAVKGAATLPPDPKGKSDKVSGVKKPSKDRSKMSVEELEAELSRRGG